MWTLADTMGELALWIALGGVGLAWAIGATVQNMFKTQMREQTRREIAAYIAEGSMTPEQGERLMRAGDESEKSD